MSLILIAISLSIDAFGIGIAYGIRDIKIPWPAKAVISFFTMIFTLVSVVFGRWAASLLPPAAAAAIGAFILFGIGIWMLRQGLRDKEPPAAPPDSAPVTVADIAIRSMGLSIRIIRDPQSCDSNHSKVIEPVEAVSLGIALSIDSLGAGFAGAVAGIGFLSIPMISVLFQLIFLTLGTLSGARLRKISPLNNRFWSFISGAALILLGVIRILNAA